MKVAARPDAVNRRRVLDQRKVPANRAVDEVPRQFRLFIHVGCVLLQEAEQLTAEPTDGGVHVGVERRGEPETHGKIGGEVGWCDGEIESGIKGVASVADDPFLVEGDEQRRCEGGRTGRPYASNEKARKGLHALERT